MFDHCHSLPVFLPVRAWKGAKTPKVPPTPAPPPESTAAELASKSRIAARKRSAVGYAETILSDDFQYGPRYGSILGSASNMNTRSR